MFCLHTLALHADGVMAAGKCSCLSLRPGLYSQDAVNPDGDADTGMSVCLSGEPRDCNSGDTMRLKMSG